MTTTRRDAVANEKLLLSSAFEAFCERRPSPSLASIARRAGVARSTAYRHFPDRQALTLAVARGTLRMLGDRMTRGGLPLRDVLREMLWLQVRLRSLVVQVESLPEPDRRRLRQEAIDVLRPAFEAAHRDGTLRPDFGPAEFIVLGGVLTAGLGQVRRPEDVERTARQLVDVLLDGLLTP